MTDPTTGSGQPAADPHATEPGPAHRRHGGDMPPIPALHEDHDPLLVASYAAGDATGTELEAAAAMVVGCPECATLHADLRAIAAATATLPAPVRSRDFRLTQTQASSLRSGGWRRLLASFAGPRFAFAGPLGAGLATLGIAGILLAGGPVVPLGGSTAAMVTTAESGAARIGTADQATAGPAFTAGPAAIDAPALAPVPSAAAGKGADAQGAGSADSNAAASPGSVAGVPAAGNALPGFAASPAASAGAAAPKDTLTTGPDAAAPQAPTAEATAPVPAAQAVPLVNLISGAALVALLAGVLLLGLRLVARRVR
jgi:hypothetical protein